LEDDLLRAHAHLLDTLIGESGQFRSGGVAVVGSDGTLLQRGALSAQVPDLVTQLLEWCKTSEAHPLIKSSAVHEKIGKNAAVHHVVEHNYLRVTELGKQFANICLIRKA
jgi:Fic family protein